MMPDGPVEAEPGAAELARFAADIAAQRLSDRVDDSQPQAAAAGGAVTARVESDKGFKHPLTRLWRNARAIILHRQRGAVAAQVQ